MTTMSSGYRYRSGYDDEQYDEPIPAAMHREVSRLARRAVLARLRTAWLGLVLLVSLAAVLAGALLSSAGAALPGIGAAVLACLGLLQLFAASLARPEP